MNYRKKSPFCIVIAVLLTLVLAACAATGTETQEQGVKIAGESLDVNGVALRPGGEAAQIYENGGMKLLIPLEYNGLLSIETPQDDANGVLFSVSEKASIEAAKAQGDEYDGAGWLFGIGAATEDALHEMLCYDMSGAEVFAKGAEGQYYMYYHPTDVRLVREDYTDKESIDQWTALSEWAATAPDMFLAENPGLTAEKRGNTSLDMYLARIAYMDNVNYTISTTVYGPMEAGDVDPMPYLNRLMNGMTLVYDDSGEAPDGEYVVLNFPEDDMRFDFFLMEGKENVIREVWAGGNEAIYQASFADGTTKASAVMNAWYNALAAENPDGAPDARKAEISVTAKESAADSENRYRFVTTLSAKDVEAFASDVRQAYLDEDWQTISTMIRYPITMYPDVKVNNAEEFLSYMSDKVIDDGDRAEMEKEDCKDLFANGQGICMATGSIWFLDVNFDGIEQVDAPLLRIISVSGFDKAD